MLIRKQSLLKATELKCIQAEDSAPQTPLQTTACMIKELHPASFGFVHMGISHYNHLGQYLCLKGDAFYSKRKQLG